MQVKIEKGHLIIALPLQTPTASASGKTKVVASTRGNKTTDVELPDFPGKKVTIGVTAYIPAN